MKVLTVLALVLGIAFMVGCIIADFLHIDDSEDGE